MNSHLIDAVQILCEGTNDSFLKVQMILEDSSSPVTRGYKEKLFKSIVDRSHIDFGSIPKSRGDITKYSGYNSMKEVLSNLSKTAVEEKSKELLNAVTIVQTAIKNIEVAKAVYIKGFAKKTNIVMLDYNTYVLTCVEATTGLLCSYIDFIKTPSSPIYTMNLKDTKYRADALFVQQLVKFNKVNIDGNYVKYLSAAIESGKDGFLGAGFIVGAGLISMIALSIIPVTRELIYLYNDIRMKLSDVCTCQAYYLELNRLTLEANTEMDPKKKKKVLDKQDAVRKKFLYLSEKLRIDSVKSAELAKKKLNEENKDMTIGGIQDDVSNSDIEIV